MNKKGTTVDQDPTVRPNEVNGRKSSDSNFQGISIKNSTEKAPYNAEMVKVASRTDKIKSKPLGRVLDSDKNSGSTSIGINKINETKSALIPQEGSSSGTFGKDLVSESNLVKQGIAYNGKVEIQNSPHQENTERAPSSKNQVSNRVLDNLNMLSKSWGEKLIEKIQKSIVDGIEKIEISLSPKSLGKLNITINMHDSIAKINIIAESSSVAALLGEAEAKLSQMMEATGLKLASLQTLTQQFGQNKKGKEQTQKIALSKKKDNINAPDKTSRKINNDDSQKEGLNLIA